MSGEFEGLGLSPELTARADELGLQSAVRQAAEDERWVAKKVNELGLRGQEAEEFKAECLAARQAGREKVRRHMLAVIESPEGKARPAAALAVAARLDLTTNQAIAKLADMPPEVDEAEAAAQLILNA